MLLCSGLYNQAAEGPRKARLRRLDHAAIFVMIAGTYTPVTLLAINDAWGDALLAVVWGGALAGAALKLFAPARFERLAVPAYLALGWVGVAAAPRLFTTLPGWGMALLLGGGLVYSLGVLAHLATQRRYHMAVWHGCVVTAAACHYVVVLDLVMTARA
jgi:hemolysin III